MIEIVQKIYTGISYLECDAFAKCIQTFGISNQDYHSGNSCVNYLTLFISRK